MLLYRSANRMIDLFLRGYNVANKAKPFFVKTPDGKRRKVNPRSRQFWGERGDHRLDHETYVNGTLFPAGDYPFVFWDVPIYDRNDHRITDSGVSPETTSGSFLHSIFGDSTASPHHSTTYNPEPAHSYMPDHGHHASSFDSGSSSFDSSSFSGSDSGGGGGGD
jgi:uncharacterized membrane protein YgcG